MLNCTANNFLQESWFHLSPQRGHWSGKVWRAHSNMCNWSMSVID